MNALLQSRWVSWRTWTSGSENRRIFGAMATVGFCSLLAKLLIVVKDLIIAPHFGLGDTLDAYYIASLLPSVAGNVAAGAFSAAVIPTYIQVREQEGVEAAQRLFSSLMVCSLALLLGLMVILGLSFPWIIKVLAPGFSPPKQAFTRGLFYALLPLIVFNGMGAIWSAILNAGERFGLAAIVPTITPILVIPFVAFGSGPFGISALVAGLVLGGALEASVLGWNIRSSGMSLRPRWYGMNAATRQVIRQYFPMVMGSLIMSGTSLVDQSMAARLGSGSVSALNYGNKIVTLINGVANIAVGTAVMPFFAAMTSRHDWPGIRRTLTIYLRLIFIVMVPTVGVLALVSEPLVRLLFQRGSFTTVDTHRVVLIQICYALQLPFIVAGTLMIRLISALKANTVLFWTPMANLVINAGLDLLFMRQIGVPGIALSTACVYLFSCLVCGMYLRFKLRACEQEDP